MKKPRLIRMRGIWHCGSAIGGVCRMGMGYTPAQAYADWLAA